MSPEASLPWNVNTSENTAYKVAIVGYGPVGATLANLLGQAGIDTVVIDKEAAHYHLPRAVHFDDEVMRVFQSIGLADAISETVRINPGMRFVDSGGTLLLDWPRPPERSSQGWHTSYRFHQPDLEQILRRGVSRFDCVNLLTHTEVLELDERGPGIELQCRDRRNHKQFRLAADFVVGCDGANSLVCRTMGTGFEDFGFDERWLVLDLLLHKDKPELGDHSIQYCDADHPATYVRGPKNRRRWEIRLNDNEADETATRPSNVWKKLERWITPTEAGIERAAVYTFNSRVARIWRVGRVMIAGDAAHLTPPFMGQGMCAGIRDVSNLGWKLIAVIRGEAKEGLLDSYGSERYNHAAEYVKTAVRLGGLINTAGTEEAIRAALKPPTGHGAAKMESIAPPLGPGIGAGNQSHRGRLFAQPQTLDGTRSDDLLGYRAILYLDPSAFPADAIRQAEAAGFGLFSTRQSTDLAGYLAALNTSAVLVRADRYIVGSANSDHELRDLCAWDHGFA